MKATKRDYTEMEAALIPLGFEHQGNGFFYHPLMEILFDFSTNSIEGAVVKIYLEGRVAGKQSLKKQIKEFFKEITEV